MDINVHSSMMVIAIVLWSGIWTSPVTAEQGHSPSRNDRELRMQSEFAAARMDLDSVGKALKYLPYLKELEAWLYEHFQINEYSYTIWNNRICINGGDNYQALIDIGPNMLPTIIEYIRNAHNERTVDLLLDACVSTANIRAGGGFCGIGDERITDEMSVDTCGLVRGSTVGNKDGYERVRGQAKAILEWWHNKHSDKIRQTVNKYLSRVYIYHERKKETIISRFSEGGCIIIGMGIYSLPALIDIISEDNKHEAFWLYMSCTARVGNRDDSKAYTHPDADYNTLWPSREERIQHIAKWWAREKHKFTRLEDLYAEIEASVEKAKAFHEGGKQE